MKQQTHSDFIHDYSPDPIVNLSFAVIQSYAFDIRKALRRHQKSEARRLLEEMKKTPYQTVIDYEVFDLIVIELEKEINK